MTRILVTGASGLLGGNLALMALDQGHDIVAVCNQNPIFLDTAEVVCADLSQSDEAEHIIKTYDPQWVFHCAAATNVDDCEEDQHRAFRLNQDMAAKVAQAAQLAGARLVHISTDAVFDGKKGGYNEEDVPDPINVYGRSKLNGELVVLETNPTAVIVRTNIYGWNSRPKPSLAEWFLERLQRKERCPGFTDVLVTLMLVNDLIEVLLQVMEMELSGLFHIVGVECISKYEFGQRVAHTFDLDASLIEPVPVSQVGLRAPRARNLCLVGTKIESVLGIQLPMVNDGLRRFYALHEEGFRDRVKGLMRRN